MKRWRSLCPHPKHSLLLIVACAPQRAERGNVARSCLHFVGYVTVYPSVYKRHPAARRRVACLRAGSSTDLPLTLNLDPCHLYRFGAVPGQQGAEAHAEHFCVFVLPQNRSTAPIQHTAYSSKVP